MSLELEIFFLSDAFSIGEEFSGKASITQLKSSERCSGSSYPVYFFTNVPYYRDLFARLRLHRADFTSLEDLSLIPILRKDTLLDYQEQFKADEFAKYRPREIRTSGTTGTPLKVYWDLDSNILELTCMWRHFSWAGWRLGEPFLDIHSRF